MFERCVCVSLSRRQDRWKRFTEGIPNGWPFPSVERYEAIDGRLCKAPDWWTAGNPAWGCYRSHLRILEECINTGVESCLFLEDDAVFNDGFVEQAQLFLDNLPKDW